MGKGSENKAKMRTKPYYYCCLWQVRRTSCETAASSAPCRRLACTLFHIQLDTFDQGVAIQICAVEDAAIAPSPNLQDGEQS